MIITREARAFLGQAPRRRTPRRGVPITTPGFETAVSPFTPTLEVCPTGFYRDPATGACLQKAGFFEDLGIGGWIAVGVGAVLLAKMLKLI